MLSRSWDRFVFDLGHKGGTPSYEACRLMDEQPEEFQRVLDELEADGESHFYLDGKRIDVSKGGSVNIIP